MSRTSRREETSSLAEDRGDVVLDGPRRQDQPLGDGGVRQALARAASSDLGLAAGQAVRVGAGVGTPAAGRAPIPAAASMRPGPGRRRLGAELVEASGRLGQPLARTSAGQGQGGANRLPSASQISRRLVPVAGSASARYGGASDSADGRGARSGSQVAT